jgi:hypothetical protein
MKSMTNRTSEMEMRDLPQIQAMDITVSGLSSGGYMAVQFHIAHSLLINGSAIFAGGPYYCAESSLSLAETRCMEDFHSPKVVDHLVSYTKDASKLGTIDNIENLKFDNVYLFSGTKDSVVDPSVMSALYNYYNAFISESNIKTKFDFTAEHCLPTINFGEPCDVLASPYLGNCNFDGAGIALEAILNDVPLRRRSAIDDHLYRFDQRPFFEGSGTFNGLADTGFMYIPSSCEEVGAKCHLHISFHGCLQTEENIGTIYAQRSGFNEWAEDNKIIVLYPYIKPTKIPANPNGCWDWWGYINEYYGLKSGVQIRFIESLIQRIITSSSG